MYSVQVQSTPIAISFHSILYFFQLTTGTQCIHNKYCMMYDVIFSMVKAKGINLMIRFYQWFSSKSLRFTFQIQKKRFSVPSGLKSTRINFFLYSFFFFISFFLSSQSLLRVSCTFECFISFIDNKFKVAYAFGDENQH